MVSCEDILKQLSEYIDDDLDPAYRHEIEEHLAHCQCCRLLLDSTRKVLLVVGDQRTFELPLGYAERLHARLAATLGS